MDGTDRARRCAGPASGTGFKIDRRVGATAGCQTKLDCMGRAMVLASAAIDTVGGKAAAANFGAPRPRRTRHKRASFAGFGAGIAKRAFSAQRVNDGETVLIKRNQLCRASEGAISATRTNILKLNALQRAKRAN